MEVSFNGFPALSPIRADVSMRGDDVYTNMLWHAVGGQAAAITSSGRTSRASAADSNPAAPRRTPELPSARRNVPIASPAHAHTDAMHQRVLRYSLGGNERRVSGAFDAPATPTIATVSSPHHRTTASAASNTSSASSAASGQYSPSSPAVPHAATTIGALALGAISLVPPSRSSRRVSLNSSRSSGVAANALGTSDSSFATSHSGASPAPVWAPSSSLDASPSTESPWLAAPSSNRAHMQYHYRSTIPGHCITTAEHGMAAMSLRDDAACSIGGVDGDAGSEFDSLTSELLSFEFTAPLPVSPTLPPCQLTVLQLTEAPQPTTTSLLNTAHSFPRSHRTHAVRKLASPANDASPAWTGIR